MEKYLNTDDFEVVVRYDETEIKLITFALDLYHRQLLDGHIAYRNGESAENVLLSDNLIDYGNVISFVRSLIEEVNSGMTVLSQQQHTYIINHILAHIQHLNQRVNILSTSAVQRERIWKGLGCTGKQLGWYSSRATDMSVAEPDAKVVIMAPPNDSQCSE